MSVVRWTATTSAFVLVAGALRWLGPEPGAIGAALADPQRLVDTAGPDALVLVVVSALAWACWAWGALGLLLTAATAAPGLAGRTAGVLLRGVLPAGARRAAAIAIGVGLSTAAPIALPAGAGPLVTASAETSTAGAGPLVTAAAGPLVTAGAGPLVTAAAGPLVTAAAETSTAGEDRSPGSPASVVQPDWPGAPETAVADPPPPVPDWPGPAAGEHVVLRGDCLWDIARDWLAAGRPAHPVADGEITDAEIASTEIANAVQAWWQANAAVIGPDPDLLLPGQVLRPPA
ncbi:hypothetical protein GCM10023328_29270 [Modestobacter marinus]|nr:hypothetical protein GCM10011589_29990 [Modestobacter marinus]